MAFMPRPMMTPLWTKTHPTGVSEVRRASSAWFFVSLWWIFDERGQRFVRGTRESNRERRGRWLRTISRASRMNLRWTCLSFSEIFDGSVGGEDKVPGLRDGG